MKIYNIQKYKQPNFGIKYVNKKAWSPNALKAFEQSEILKSIDEKYPEASVAYANFSDNNGIANTETVHTIIMDIKLAKDKIFRWNLSSHFENIPEKYLIKDLKTMTLEFVERKAMPITNPIEKVAVNSKQNPITSFLRKIF